MLPNPLHPAVVHFPVVLAFLVPLFAIGAVWAIRRGARPRRAWSIPLAAALALAGSAWAAVETGEAQDERVERVVAEQPLSRHEEMAETFLTASAGLAIVAAAGLIGGIAGRAARVATALGSVGLLAGAAMVGHTGGELVYKYGAASAYTSDSTRAPVADAQSASASRQSISAAVDRDHREPPVDQRRGRPRSPRAPLRGRRCPRIMNIPTDKPVASVPSRRPAAEFSCATPR